MDFYDRPPEMDDRDRAILAERVEALNAIDGPRVGDFVKFPGDITRRISYIWGDESELDWYRIQTSNGGSWYLGKGYVSFSGSLYVGVPGTSFYATDETRA